MKKKIIRKEINCEPAGMESYPAILRQIFAARGVIDAEEIDYGLNNLLPPNLKGIDAALELLLEAIQQQQRILIVGDFDVDGATSTSVAFLALKAFGCEHVEFLVPNRFDFGYGLTPEIVEHAKPLNPQLLITVDNGISSLAGVEYAQSLGLKVLVTDHHLPGKVLPSADAIVNPNQPGCEFLSKAAAGVGVIFYLMMAFRSRLRSTGWFENRQEPNMAGFLDLVALGTVCDVVPLDANNRILVSQGLRRIRAGQTRPGIKALLRVAGKELDKLSTSDLGFLVGPRLNAAGRLDDMTIGIRCLMAESEGEALALAQDLDNLNRERRSIEQSMQVEAMAELEQMESEFEGPLPKGICLFKPDWHQGVIGILASRIKDRLHRPVIIFAESGEGELKGSGRSIQGIHLRDVLDEVATQNEGLLDKFGGHAMAAGLSLSQDNLERFQMAFDKVVTQALGSKNLEPIIESDGELGVEDLQLNLAQNIHNAGPWGQAFPEPVFDGEFAICDQRIVGDKHLKLVLSPSENRDCRIDAIAFNVETKVWPNFKCEKVKVAYKLSINEYRGRSSLQLMIDYLEAV